MEGLVLFLVVADSIAIFVCFILALIQLFKHAGVGLGILGIFCSIFTFIWGWVNAKKYGFTTLMIVWTILIAISFVLPFLVPGMYSF
jgi:hypothetical protein